MTPGWLTDIRSKAKARFDEVGYPTAKLEDWRFTNVSPISKQSFHASKNGLVLGEAFRAAFFSRGARLAFVNGKFAPALSSLAGLPAGVVVGNLAALYADPKEGPQ